MLADQTWDEVVNILDKSSDYKMIRSRTISKHLLRLKQLRKKHRRGHHYITDLKSKKHISLSFERRR